VIGHVENASLRAVPMNWTCCPAISLRQGASHSSERQGGPLEYHPKGVVAETEPVQTCLNLCETSVESPVDANGTLTLEEVVGQGSASQARHKYCRFENGIIGKPSGTRVLKHRG
jgi:hypothetical protein